MCRSRVDKVAAFNEAKAVIQLIEGWRSDLDIGGEQLRDANRLKREREREREWRSNLHRKGASSTKGV